MRAIQIVLGAVRVAALTTFARDHLEYDGGRLEACGGEGRGHRGLRSPSSTRAERTLRILLAEPSRLPVLPR